jgi:hypothetical protein
MMQILTGRGIFNHYRYRIWKETHTRCWDCGDDQDDAKRVLFKCPRWTAERAALESDIEVEFRLENNVIRMLSGKDKHWQNFTRFCATAIKA